MAAWKTLQSDVVYETAWFKVRRDKVLNQNDTPLTYSYMELQHPTVFIIAVDDEGKILLQNVYRHPIHRRIWEIPAGHSDADEDLLVAARRELREETGFVSDDWHRLGRIQQITGVGNVPAEFFLARHVQKVGDASDKDEDIEGHTFTDLTTIEAMIANGELIDCPVLAAVYMAKIYGLQKEEE
jgi:8-oxo-dGTP pyrophosphatase MutT (NUDIX family)